MMLFCDLFSNAINGSLITLTLGRSLESETLSFQLFLVFMLA